MTECGPPIVGRQYALPRRCVGNQKNCAATGSHALRGNRHSAGSPVQMMAFSAFLTWARRYYRSAERPAHFPSRYHALSPLSLPDGMSSGAVSGARLGYAAPRESVETRISRWHSRLERSAVRFEFAFPYRPGRVFRLWGDEPHGL